MSGPLLGVTLKIAATFAFTLMVTLVKLVADRLPVGEVVFARSALGLIPVLLMLAWQRELPRALRTSHPGGHFLRAIVGTTSMFFWFASLALLPLPDATAINYAGPLICTALAAILLGEKVRLYRWSAVTIGFLGVLVVLSPHLGGFTSGRLDGAAVGALYALGSAFFAALAMVTIRRLTATEGTGAIVFYFSGSAALLALTTAPFGWVMPSAGDAFILLCIGLTGGVGQVLMTQSYRHAEASVIAPFDYTSMIWVILLGILVFDEIPTLTVLAGSAIVVAAGIFVILRERQLGIERARARKANTPS